MKRFQKLIALLLAVVLTASVWPAVYADEGEIAAEPVIIEEPVSTEETVITEEAAADSAQEKEQTSLPYGLTGMPEDYTPSADALEQKKLLADTAAKLAELTPGTDYVENEVLTMADSREEADLIAVAFNGQVKKYAYGMVTISLQECTVAEAVTASADMQLNLPAVQPNYLTQIEIVHTKATKSLSEWIPVEQTWESWVQQNMENPDLYLRDPSKKDAYQWQHDAVDSYAAWGVADGRNVTVAVIDSGVDAAHEDLGQRVYTRDIGCGTEPVVEHGTHVAGIIAAQRNNGIGGAGIAPNANILSYCVAGSDGSVADDAIIAAIRDAADSGAWIINMSFGTPHYNYYVQQAVDYAYRKGVTCIAAIGNSATNTMMYPAAYNHVIAVMATERSGSRAKLSNYGSWSDVSAPGMEILSTVPGGYDTLDGTSMAAPMVSGLAALYMSVNGHVNPDTMEKVLEKSMVNGVVNASKMFSNDKTAPEGMIQTSAGTFSVSYFGRNSIPFKSKLWLYDPSDNLTSVIIYTTDGTTPRVKNGQPVNGEYCTGAIDLSPYSGQTVTVKAIRITGMGIVSKTLTLRLKVGQSTDIAGVTIEGPDVIVAGKTGQFKATVEAEGAVSQQVTWSIQGYSNATRYSKLDKYGKLKTEKNREGFVTICARSVANPNYYCEKTVQVKVIEPVSKINLSTKKMTVGAGYIDVFSYELLDAKGNKIDPAVSGVEFVSSKTSVVQVGGDTAGSGWIIGVKKGTATITVKTRDGSGKYAKINVTVSQVVESLSVSGQQSIAPGASATYKTTAYPSTASNKKVTWELVGAPAGVTVSSKGLVKVPSGAAVGSSFTVRATAADGYGAVGEYKVTIARKSSKLTVDFYNYTNQDNRPVWKNGSITSVELYTVDRPDREEYDESMIMLYGVGDNGQYGTWTSNSSAVSIEPYGRYCIVKAQKNGTAKLTCTLQDGSGKKASVTVKVSTPSSQVSISPTTPCMGTDIPYVAFGRTISFKATLANTYGTVSNKKVTWGVRLYGCLSNGQINTNSDMTSAILSKKLCYISNGTLTVKKGIEAYWGGYGIRAIVSCTDAYGNTASEQVYIVPPTKTITPYSKTVNMPSNYSVIVYFKSDQWRPGYIDEAYTGFVISTSNSNLVGEYAVAYAGSGIYAIILTSGKTGVRGTATITIKALDNGRTAKIKVNVNDKYR